MGQRGSPGPTGPAGVPATPPPDFFRVSGPDPANVIGQAGQDEPECIEEPEGKAIRAPFQYKGRLYRYGDSPVKDKMVGETVLSLT